MVVEVVVGGEFAGSRGDPARVGRCRAAGVLGVAVSVAAAPWPVHASDGAARAAPREIDPAVPTAVVQPEAQPTTSAPAPRRVEPREDFGERTHRRPGPAPVPPPHLPPTGVGLIVGGGLALGVGGLGLLGGGLLRRDALMDDRPRCHWETGPDDCNPRLFPGGGGGALMFLAAPIVAAGLVMLALGLGQRGAYRQHLKRSQRGSQPYGQRMIHGASGVVLRF